MNPFSFLKRDRRDELSSLSIQQLLDLQIALRARAAANLSKRRELQTRDRAGLTDDAVRAHTSALLEVEQFVGRDEAESTVLSAAISDAREVERDRDADRDAHTLPAQLHAALRTHADAVAVAREAAGRVEALSNRVADERVRRRLLTDPTLGVRPALLAILPVNCNLARLLREGVAIALGARERDRWPTLVIVPGDREADHFDGLDLIDNRERLLSWQRAATGTVHSDSRAAVQLAELYRRFGLDPVVFTRRLGTPALSAGERARREADEKWSGT